MAVIDPTAVYMVAPEYGLDNIVAIYTGSLSLAAPTGGFGDIFRTATATHNSGFNENCYYQGFFTVDNNNVYNDLGAYTPDLTGGFLWRQTQTVRAFVTSAGVLTVIGVNWFNVATGTSAPHTLTYKIFLMAKNTQGNITPTGTNEFLYFNSAYNYQKIFMEGLTTSSTTINTTINHNLGYVPKARVWFQPSANVTGAADFGYTLPSGCMSTMDWYVQRIAGVTYGQVNVNTTNLIVGPVNNTVTGQINYRVYLDA